MHLRLVKKGSEYSKPIERGFWTSGKAIEDGVLVILTATEAFNRGLFIEVSKLNNLLGDLYKCKKQKTKSQQKKTSQKPKSKKVLTKKPSKLVRKK